MTDQPTTSVPSSTARPARRPHVPAVRVGPSPTPRQRLHQLVYLRDVTLHLVGRELAARHRDSLFGWLWSLTPALLQLLVTHFLFTRVIPLGVENYAVFLLIGILAYNWFQRSLTTASSVLVSSRTLVLRPGFPMVVLPVVSVLVGFVDYLLAFPILIVVLALTTGLRIELALFPLVLLIQFVLTLGFAWIVACLTVFLRDMRQIVGLVVGLGFWITPVFYRQRQVPEAFSLVYDLNPMAYVIEAHRGALLGEGLPSTAALVGLSAFSLGVSFVGLLIFNRLRHGVPDRL